MRVLFLGTPDFAAASLLYLIESDIHIVAVVTQPPRASGRGQMERPSPVAQLIQSRYPHIPLFIPTSASSPKSIEALRSLEIDLIVVVAYGQILSPELLSLPRVAAINLHPSLLPKYRGAAPIQRTLMAGETQSGVTIMHLARELDAGDIILQHTVSVPSEMTFGELESLLCRMGSELLVDALHQLEGGKAPRIPQKDAEATYASKILPEECRLNWGEPALTLHNRIRALSPRPGAWCEWPTPEGAKRLKILRSLPRGGNDAIVGLVQRPSPEELLVSTGEGGALQLLEVQLEGRRPSDISNFLRGWHSPLPALLL